MIVVTLGTIPYPFERAVGWISELIRLKVISESVFIQHGVTNIDPLLRHRLVTASPIVESDRFIDLIDQASLVISHAGQGSTRLLAERRASFVLLPRLAQYREHIDDHQLFFAKSVKNSGVGYCSDIGELASAVSNPPPRFDKRLFEEASLVEHLVKAYPGQPQATNVRQRKELIGAVAQVNP